MNAMPLKQEVKKIFSLGWNAKSVSDYLDVTEGTLHDVLHRNKRAQLGSRSKTIRITYFRIFLEKLFANGLFPTRELVDSVPVMGERSFSTFIKEFYSKEEQLVTYIINESVDKFLSNRFSLDFVALFKEKFGGVINEKTLTQAALKEPQFLADFITQGKIKNFTKALALSKLGLAGDDTFLGLIKSLILDPSPLVREGAYQALAEYFLNDEDKYSYLYEDFKNALETETGEGVKKQIVSLMKVMEMYK
jgi:hypothetical protein